jgi:tryptophanyl-tRNA synthetase
MMKKRILSCMQPTNQLHLGNYLGALKNWVKLQEEQCEFNLFGIVDLHAITQPYDTAGLKAATQEIAAAYIAGGIDVSKSILFVQSAVPEHAQLNWLLTTMTQVGKLDRMTQFKDKAGKNKEKAGLGLYSYPVLMAADILVYKATHVPVGDDQKQHLELARDIAATFNHRYGQDYFPMPETIAVGAGTRVMSLRDGSEKMSKSAESDMSRINLTDDADTISKKIKKAKTDPEALPSDIKGLENRPEAANLVSIYAGLNDMSVEAVLKEFGGAEFSQFKPALADLAVAKLSPISTEMTRLLNDRAEIDAILRKGSEKARSLATPIYKEIFDIMGFWS